MGKNFVVDGNNERVTVYYAGSMMGNIIRIEAKLVEHGRMPYAQYNSVPFAKYTPKRKRSSYRFVDTSRENSLLIVKGWNTPEADGLWGEKNTENGLTVTKSLYRSFDDGWKNDFNTMINKAIEEKKVEVVYDGRGLRYA